MMPTPYIDMSPRELQIVRLVAQGKENKEVACELGVSEHTVRTHLRSVFTALNIHNRTTLTAWAWREGIMAEQQNNAPAR